MGVRDIVTGEMADPFMRSTKASRGAEAIYHICPNVSPHEISFAPSTHQ